MKILTINTHSLIEKDYEKKCEYFKNAIINHKPDIIAMQEVNQSKWARTVDNSHFSGDIPIKSDNHALKICKMLREESIDYHFNWLGIKNGYKPFDEGLSILSLVPIDKTDSLLLSKTYDYNNWKTRMAQIAKIGDKIIVNVHMGWWNDDEEPFLNQFQKLNEQLFNKEQDIFLVGDFNSPSNEKNTGYDTVLSGGWYDTYTLAEDKDDGITVSSKIDGWKDNDKKRIDYIFTNKKIPVKSSKVIFNGKNEKIISDHFGVIIEI